MCCRCVVLAALLGGCSFNTDEFRLAADAPHVDTMRQLDADGAAPPPDVDATTAPDTLEEPTPPDVSNEVPDEAPVDVSVEVSIDASGDTSVDVPAEAEAGVEDMPSSTDVDECPIGQTRCGDQCVDTNVSIDHCGRCSNRCNAANATSACAAGACVFACNRGFADCDMNPSNGCEANLSSPLTCGSCSNRCVATNGTPTCTGGVCGLTCNPGFGDCDGNTANGCETNTNNSTAHCGACGRACGNGNGTPACSSGTCQITCDRGFLDCDGSSANGCETFGLNDSANCGACNNRCPAMQTCMRGACTAVCTDTLCGSACVDLMSNVSHCGACNRACSTANGTPRCVSGTCGIATCNSGFANCDSNPSNGCETNLQSDLNNCGVCANRCNLPNAVSACVGGTCTIASCMTGFANCDGNVANGCETNLTGDVGNCGACSNRCNVPNGTPRCLSGTCSVAACNTGFANCDGDPRNGCEINTLTDPFNCGACGTRCTYHHGNISNTCSNGACMPMCSMGFANCDGDPRNGCESSLNTNNACGGCGRSCSLSCSAGVCTGVSPGVYTRVTSPRTFIDACAAPGAVRLLPSVDDSSAPFTLPFPVRFWSSTLAAGTQIGIGSNGWINMMGTSANDLRALIPDPASPNGIVAVYMLDLFTSTTGVCVATIASTPRALVVEWRDVLFYNPRGTPQDFEVVFNEGSTAIDLLYRTVAPTPPGYQAAVGLESPNGVAAAVVCNGASQSCGVSNGTAIRFQ